jgi:hypothetical protein
MLLHRIFQEEGFVMTMFKLAGTTAVAALISGQAAWADISPEEVWQKWKDASASYGQTLTTTSEVRDGDTLTISGANFASTQEGAEASVTVEEIAFTDKGDGTVAVTMSDTVQMAVKGENPDGGEPTDVLVDITAPDLTIVASGTAAETGYAVTAPELKFALASVDGVAADAIGANVAVTVKGINGTYAASGTDSRTIDSDIKADGMDIAISVKEPETTNIFALNSTTGAITSVSSTTLPKDLDLTDMVKALAAGFQTKANVTFGKTDFTFDAAEGTDTTKGSGSIAGAGMDVQMNATNLNYLTTTQGLSIAVSGSTIPFPEVKVAFAESAFGLAMPISKSDTPADFSLLTKLVDLTISDDIWGMIDPTANLPRDPVTIILDTKGTATLAIDIMDTAAMEAAGETPPGELNSFDLKDLTLRALGAEVNGTGALTFDNTDKVTFQGMPKPTGTINLNASGINGLIDKLIAMGMIPEDQLMGARMMLGMFAKPGESADTLTSTLEFKDGGFFANGMQIQ